MSKVVNMRNLYYEKMELTNLKLYYGPMTVNEALVAAIREENKMKDTVKSHPVWVVLPNIKRTSFAHDDLLNYAELLEKEENEKKAA